MARVLTLEEEKGNRGSNTKIQFLTKK
jgi:hypothetical protein